jgi:hypothetical protein
LPQFLLKKVFGRVRTSVLEQAMATAVKPQNKPHGRRRHRSWMSAGAGASALLLLAGIAAAQTRAEPPKPANDPPAAAPAPAPPPPPAADSPGFVGAFGNWMQQGVTSMSTGFDAMVGAAKGAADAASTVAKGAADAAKGAAGVAVDGVSKLPAAGLASGREQCTLAGNGAPDCRVAAEALCRARGYGTGTSVDFETSEKCPPPYRTSGRDTPYRLSSQDRPEGVCTMEHFVTRALCK